MQDFTLPRRLCVDLLLLVGMVALSIIAPSMLPAQQPPPPGAEPAGLEIPGRPADGRFLNDYAGLVHRNEFSRIANAQRLAFHDHDVPIIVVTVPSMAAFGGHGMSIEDFAREWFDSWGIGTLDRPDGANKGILLLVSRDDRRARIELGADWGSRWDRHARRIMDDSIIPHFSRGNYSQGIARGVQELSAMAQYEPSETPSILERTTGLVDQAINDEPLTPLSFVPGWIGLLLIAFGVILIVAGIRSRDHRTVMIWIGFIIIAIALFTWVVIMVVIVLSRFFGWGGGGRGGFGSIGGFGGGFSGGGGASGRW